MDLTGIISRIATITKYGQLDDLKKIHFNDAERKLYTRGWEFYDRPYQFASHCHLNTHRQALSFDDKPYLIDLYQDPHPDIVIKKSVQCGISEMLICCALAYAEYGYSALYVLPKFALRGRFVYNRIDPLFQIVPEYRELCNKAVGEADNVGLKHFGKGVMNFVGSNSPSEFIEYQADMLIIDEMDSCEQDNILLANDRLDASKLKHSVKVSTPTYNDYGIQAEYDKSDQKEWYVRCDACGEYQYLEWETHVVRQISEGSYELRDRVWDGHNGDVQIFCSKCNRPLNRLSKGAWGITNNNIDISGYHISQLFSANTTVAELWQNFQAAQSNETKLQIFYNSKLGMAYSPRGTKLSVEVLDRCRRNYIMGEAEREIFGGIDIGAKIHYIFCEHVGREYFRLIDCGTVSNFSELNLYFAKWKPKRVILDIEPETRKAKEFRDSNGGVWLCDYYGGATTTTRDAKVDVGERIITVDRTQTLDRMYAKFYNEECWLPKNAKVLLPTIGDKSELYAHLMNLQRVIKESSGRQKAFWTKLGDDHLAHCFNYMLLSFWIYQQYGSPEVS